MYLLYVYIYLLFQQYLKINLIIYAEVIPFMFQYFSFSIIAKEIYINLL